TPATASRRPTRPEPSLPSPRTAPRPPLGGRGALLSAAGVPHSAVNRVGPEALRRNVPEGWYRSSINCPERVSIVDQASGGAGPGVAGCPRSTAAPAHGPGGALLGRRRARRVLARGAGERRGNCDGDRRRRHGARAPVCTRVDLPKTAGRRPPPGERPKQSPR